jgi:hypothetical protein
MVPHRSERGLPPHAVRPGIIKHKPPAQLIRAYALVKTIEVTSARTNFPQADSAVKHIPDNMFAMLFIRPVAGKFVLALGSAQFCRCSWLNLLRARP